MVKKLTPRRIEILRQIDGGANRITDLEKAMRGKITQLGIIKALNDMEKAGFIERKPTGRGREKIITLKSKAKSYLKRNGPEEVMREIQRGIGFLKSDTCRRVFKSLIVTGTIQAEEMGLTQNDIDKCVRRLIETRIMIEQQGKLTLTAFGIVVVPQGDWELRGFIKSHLIGEAQSISRKILKGPFAKKLDDVFSYLDFEPDLDKIIDEGPTILFELMEGRTYKELMEDDQLFQRVDDGLYQRLREALAEKGIKKLTKMFLKFLP